MIQLTFTALRDLYYRGLYRLRRRSIQRIKTSASRDAFIRDAAGLFGVSEARVRELVREPIDLPALIAARESLARLRGRGHGSGSSSSFDIDSLYVLVRLLTPEKVVESGVLYGASSAHILAALEQNGAGHLYSFDLPWDRAGAKPGAAVPDSLRDRWTLTLGDSRSELPAFFRSHEQIDLFHHDSLHTYSHMSWEYQQAWPHIQSGGLLTSHDVLLNPAFDRFLRSRREEAAGSFVSRNIGVIRRKV